MPSSQAQGSCKTNADEVILQLQPFITFLLTIGSGVNGTKSLVTERTTHMHLARRTAKTTTTTRSLSPG